MTIFLCTRLCQNRAALFWTHGNEPRLRYAVRVRRGRVRPFWARSQDTPAPQAKTGDDDILTHGHDAITTARDCGVHAWPPPAVLPLLPRDHRDGSQSWLV
jgi:hypothetical protein